MTIRTDARPRSPAVQPSRETTAVSQAETTAPAPGSAFDPQARPENAAVAHVPLPTLGLDDGAPPPVGPFPPEGGPRGHGGKPLTATAEPNTPIPDQGTVSTTVTFDDEFEIDTLKLNLDLAHSYRGDLVVTLTSPSGRTAVISDRAGGSADDLQGAFDLSAFAGDQTKGTWTLTVEDKARLDTGTVRSWGLEIQTISRPEPAVSKPMPVLGKGEVTDRYTAELHGKDGILYSTTWGRRRNSGDTIHIWDTRGGEMKAAGAIQIPGAGTIGDVQVSEDGKLLIACTERGQVLTYDLSDPLNPRHLGTYQSPSGRGEVHTAELANVNGKPYAFLSNIYARPPKLVALDLSDPSKPREVSATSVGSPYQHDVWVKDGLLFAAGWDQGMTIFDIGGGGRGGSPENPVKVSTIATKNGSVHNIATYRDPDSGKTFAFIGEEVPGSIGKSSRGDIHVVDITDLENPREVAFFNVPGAGTHNFSLDAEKGILYAAYYNGGVRALDIRGDLAHGHADEISADGRIDLGKQGREIGHALGEKPGENYVWGVHLMDGHLYASDMLNGVWKLDPSVLTLPNRPHEH